MLKDLFFIIKMVGLSILVCVLLQVKVGTKTIEQEFYSWIQTSILVDHMQTAIDGGVAIIKTGYKQMHAVVTKTFNKMSRHEKKAERGLSINLKRHNDNVDDEEDNQNSFLPKVRPSTTEVK